LTQSEREDESRPKAPIVEDANSPFGALQTSNMNRRRLVAPIQRDTIIEFAGLAQAVGTRSELSDD
jgi:hypothetical protein